MIYKILIFLVINFAGLGIGGIFTGKGVPSDWYQNLDKAPWTPPGWVFGAAWTTIMICFSVFMAFLWNKQTQSSSGILVLFIMLWVLNVIWSPVFFHFHLLLAGLIIISLLAILVFYLAIKYFPETGYKTLLLVPYMIWIIIATSLNAYILLKN